MHLPSWTLAVVVAVITLGVSCQAQTPVPSGVWAGTYSIGDLHQFVRVDLSGSIAGSHEPGMEFPRARRSDLVGVSVQGNEIRFGLPAGSRIITFTGIREANSITGTVSLDGIAGSFHLMLEVAVANSAYAPYQGPYRVGDERQVLFMNGVAERPIYHYFEGDRLVSIFPVSETTFLSELGEVFHFDLTSLDQVLRVERLSGEEQVGHPIQAYRDEEVHFSNGAVQLAGSLLIPHGEGPFPVVVFVHGSQGDNREPYRHYADHFASRGIAALIYDKRGTGASTGNWRRADFAHLTGDVLAAVDFLKGHPDINPRAIGVWGISQGGWIVASAAVLDPEIAFVIGVSAAGVSPGKQEAYRVRNVLVDAGLRGLKLELAVFWHRLLYPLGHLITKPYVPAPRSLKDMVGGLAPSPSYKPLPVWKQVRQPVLLIYGENDWLVDPQESPRLITQALDDGGNPKHTVITHMLADHSIRVAQTARPSEILSEIRFAPGYFQETVDWVLNQVGELDGDGVLHPDQSVPGRLR